MKTFNIPIKLHFSLQCVQQFAEGQISVEAFEKTISSVNTDNFYVLYDGASLLQVVIEYGYIAEARLSILIDLLLEASLKDKDLFRLLLTYSRQDTQIPLSLALYRAQNSLLPAKKILDWIYLAVREQFLSIDVFDEIRLLMGRELIASAKLGETQQLSRDLNTLE